MNRIWEVKADHIEHLQGQDRPFADFVNNLLTIQARRGHLPDASLRLNMNTLAPDGGIDAAVDQAISPGDDPTGYFRVPSCWQYKATSTGHIKPPKDQKGGQPAGLAHEINKPESRRLIALGYGYRLCIADELPPDRIHEWEGWLLDEARKISTDAPPPIVLTASRLATWASRYPGLVRTLRPDLGPFRDLQTWGKEIQYLTEKYYSVPAWQGYLRQVREMADFQLTPVRAVLTIAGEAGVGKTRCVFEALAADPASQALIVYTTNEAEAELLVSHLAGNPEANALIIADECGLQVAVRLERCLRAHAGRLRVIAINNQQQSEQTSIGELRLSRLSEKDVEQILALNFPTLLHDRRRAFAYLSQGFVRLAVDLCENEALIPESGGLDGSLVEYFSSRYLSARLNEREHTAVLLVSLVSRVGFCGDVAGQLADLSTVCAGAKLSSMEIVEIARRLKQSPGFIAIGERYLYVTPRLIAHAAFRAAWERWVRSSPSDFFLGLPPGLEEPFFVQLRDAGTDEMRRACADFFLTWMSQLTIPDLGNDGKARRLMRLADVEPSTILPGLRRLVESATVDKLRALHSSHFSMDMDIEEATRAHEAQASRRELVWLAERFLLLPEHFHDAERILFRLALAETETYGNNATGVWRSVFRLYLSGTPVHYLERLKLLESRFYGSAEDQQRLCLAGLETAVSSFQGGLGRALGPPVVAGRIPPPDWKPASSEVGICWRATVDLLASLTTTSIREEAFRLAIKELPTLILLGALDQAREMLQAGGPLPEDLLVSLLRRIDEFIDVFCEPKSKRVPPTIEARMHAWRDELVPSSLHGRLVATIGQEPWHLWGRGRGEQEPGIEALARELLSDRDAFTRELSWLLSEHAKSAVRLGVHLGELDEDGELLEPILMAAAASSYPGLARGYVKGLVERHQKHLAQVNEVLDSLQQGYPQAVFDIASGAGAPLHALPRLLAMVDSKQLPPAYLRGYFYAGERHLPVDELAEVLRRLVAAAQSNDVDAARAGLNVLWMQVGPHGTDDSPPELQNPSIRALLPEILRSSWQSPGRESHAWKELLGHLSDVNPEEAITIAGAALLSEDLSVRNDAAARLETLASTYAGRVMERLGEALLGPDGPLLGLQELQGVVGAIPPAVVRNWLETHGAAAAKAIARHLPPPVVADGSPHVPELTAYVLGAFEDNDCVFREFCAGMHSGDAYWGDVDEQLEAQMEMARHFLTHPLPRVREWARHTIEHGKEMAAFWRASDEEKEGPG